MTSKISEVTSFKMTEHEDATNINVVSDLIFIQKERITTEVRWYGFDVMTSTNWLAIQQNML